jgi:hypothetical protein
VSFLRSRWVEAPVGVEELEPTRLAPGFRAAGTACGLKGTASPTSGCSCAIEIAPARRCF